MSTEIKTPKPAVTSDWDLHSRQDKELVKGLGLTSATMLVMGSMIGSGIFIVSAEISREVDSPALLIGAWLVTGFLTIVGALSYGELAAMMPRAGGQYVYLRESLGPLMGIPLRVDALPGDSDRYDRCGRSGLRKVSRYFLSFDLFFELDRAFLESAAHSYWPHGPGKYGNRTEHSESGGDSGGRACFQSSIFSA